VLDGFFVEKKLAQGMERDLVLIFVASQHRHSGRVLSLHDDFGKEVQTSLPVGHLKLQTYHTDLCRVLLEPSLAYDFEPSLRLHHDCISTLPGVINIVLAGIVPVPRPALGQDLDAFGVSSSVPYN